MPGPGWKSRLVDGQGTAREAGVTGNHALKVTQVPLGAGDIPFSVLTAKRQYREYFTLGGDGTTRDLNVNGSVTAQEFLLLAPEDEVHCIKRIRFLLEDGNMEIASNDFRRFGTAAAAPGLANGITLTAVQSGDTTDIFTDPVKNSGDFLNYVDTYINFKDAISAGVDYLAFDLLFPEPIILPAGTQDTISLTVRDDLTSVDSFLVIADGCKESI